MKKLILALTILLTACSLEKDKPINGYVEGDFIYISTTSSGLLKDIYVCKGQNVKKGDALFSLDIVSLKAELTKAVAEKEQAQANLNNLTKGKRPEEIEIILKQKKQAEANLLNAKNEYERVKPLFKDDVISKTVLDNRKAEYDVAKAKVQEFSAQLAAASLGARIDEISVAQNAIVIAEQKIIQAQKMLSEAQVVSDYNAFVEDVFYQKGEYVKAGSAIVSLLPPENIKVRFFVSQEVLPKFSLNKEVEILCDGCNKLIKAHISYLSPQAEFTPPVIYSVESRDKLVFMLEAQFNEINEVLPVGLPVDIKVIEDE